MHETQPDLERPLLAIDVVEQMQLSDAARARLLVEFTPQQFFAELAKHELYADAVQLAAHYFSPREAVWWGCLCAWQVARDRQQTEQTAALDAVVRWVQRPTDANRQAAHAAAQAVGTSHVAGVLGLAAFYAGSSISPPDQSPVAPPPGLAARVVSGAVQLAATLAPTDFYKPCLRHFLQLAGEVSRGEAPWGDAIDDAVNSTSTCQHECDHARPTA